MSVGFADDDTVNVPSLAIFISLPVYSVVLSELYGLYVTVLSVNTSAFPFLTTASYLLLLGICTPTIDFTSLILSFVPISFYCLCYRLSPKYALQQVRHRQTPLNLQQGLPNVNRCYPVSTETPSANSSSIFHSAVPNAVLPSIIFADIVIGTFTVAYEMITICILPVILNAICVNLCRLNFNVIYIYRTRFIF